MENGKCTTFFHSPFSLPLGYRSSVALIDNLCRIRYNRVNYRRCYLWISAIPLKEKFLGTGSGNLTELEEAINHQAQKGYRLHTITTSNGGSKGLMGGDRIQATMVFEKVI